MTATLYIITGPTAVGKTAFALDFAATRGGEIVSCDALLLYRGMDVGTAKPSPAERARVPHHLIDIQPVDQPCDVVRFDAAARRAVADIAERGKTVVVAGGSGFYLKSFFAPVTDAVEVPDAVRSRVAGLCESGGLPALLAELRAHSPGGLGSLDTRNPRRVQRALERCLAAGRPLAELQAEFAARPQPYPEFRKHLILLERSREELSQRIRRRVQAMLHAGLVDEVRRLRQAGLERNPAAATAIGYRETLACLRGELEPDDLEDAIVLSTLRLAKKQRTWFRTQLPDPDRRIALED